mgnify:FL=1
MKVKQVSREVILLEIMGFIRGVPLTPSSPLVYLSRLVFERRTSMDRAAKNEADIQAPQSQAGEQARVPRPHEDHGRAEGDQPAAEAGSGVHHSEGREQVAKSLPRQPERLPRGARIGSSSDIRRLLEQGARKRTRSLDIFFAASPVSRSRLGLIVPKHGNRVVDRNLLKRRLREIGRRQILPGLSASGVKVDVLIRAKRRAYEVEFDKLAKEAEEALEGLCLNDS